jgi:hypothetical protein
LDCHIKRVPAQVAAGQEYVRSEQLTGDISRCAA